MNGVILFVTVASFSACILGGCPQRAYEGMAEGCMNALLLCAHLAAMLAVFCAVEEIWREAGALRAVTRVMKGALRRLLHGAPDEALEAACANLAANMLGLGNAATPPGIEAMRHLPTRADGSAGEAMCMFLALNASSVQLLPSAVLALRTAAGSASPGWIILPTLVATGVSTLTAVLLCKGMEKVK